MGEKTFHIAVLDQALMELEATIQKMPTDAYSRHMALLRKLPEYIPTEAEKLKLKVVEGVRYRLEMERGAFVPEAVIAYELNGEERGVLIEALQRRVEMLRKGCGFPDDILEAISNDDRFTPITRADYLADEEDVLRRLEALQGEVPAGGHKVPSGFVGFCVGKIEAMPLEERERFLSVNSGDSSFYDVPKKWNEEWKQMGNKAYKVPGQGVSKAKKRYRELNEELKS